MDSIRKQPGRPRSQHRSSNPAVATGFELPLNPRTAAPALAQVSGSRSPAHPHRFISVAARSSSCHKCSVSALARSTR